MPDRSARAPLQAALVAAALASGVALCLHYGRIGFMPLDQSIVFDGGWRVLSGQVPGRDFVTPSGLVPILLQSLFFKVLGVTWFAYCLHAALINGLFAVVALRVLQRLGAPDALALFYAVLSAVVMYPPFGVPFMDQHAFFFGLVMVHALVALVQAPAGRRTWPAVAAAAAALLGYLSKPIPTVLFVPLAAAALLALPRGERARAGGTLLGAVAALTVGLVALAAAAGIGPGTLIEQSVLLPLRVGAPRVTATLEPWRWPAVLGQVTLAWRLVSVAVIHVAFLVMLVVGLRRARRVREPLFWTRLVLAEYLVAVCTVVAALTKNEPENAVPYVFVSLGLTHLSVLALVARETPPPGPDARPSRAPRWLTAALVLLAAADAGAFNARVNATRLVAGVAEAASAPGPLPPALSFMVWRDPVLYGYSAADLAQLVAFLRENEGAFLLVGDTSILYGLTGRPSVNPALWFHPRLTMPGRLSAGFVEYQRRLLDNMRRRRVRFVVVETSGTFMGMRPGQFPVLVDLIHSRGTGRRAFGTFDVIELRPPLE